MTFEQKKKKNTTTTTYRTSVWRRGGWSLFCYSRAGGSSIGAELFYSARSFTWEISGFLRESQHKATELGGHSGVLFISELMAPDGSWFARCFRGCKYRAHIRVICFSLPFFLSLYYGLRDEDTSPFLHIIPPAKVHYSNGSNSIHTGFLGVDLEEDGILRCV
ncbi:hypothetical protein F5B19DRAFT_369030 [Rostrohypoxylon terebratum]|nr:hypothetical protein F5B19DRAFT_369030 [Rostrohypoxylon terebratum]